jgi:magnesium-transporting ATPase (P-type)
LEANVRTVIISGDSELTSGAVAFGCGMLDNNELVYCDLHVDSRGKKKISMKSKDWLIEKKNE